jgi:serine/threonine protein kinase
MLASYTLQEELGRGTYGAVYRATRDEQVYALKEQLYQKNGSLPHGFLREAAVVLNVRHPNIVAASELLFLEDRLVLVLECATLTLSAWLRKERSLKDKIAVAYQILAGLVFLHTHHCIHCDLKPDNILMFKDGSVKIADFGLAVRSFGQPLSTNVQSLWWRAPEVIQARERYTTAIDMWSYGVLVFQLLSGRHLFTETEPLQLLRCQQTQLESRLSALAVSLELRALLRGCLQDSPSERWSARQALESSAFTLYALGAAPVGNWSVRSHRGTGEHWYLHKLQLDTHTQELAGRLVAKLERVTDAKVVACSAIAVMLLQNVWPVVPTYTPETLRLEVQSVCSELHCAFY